MAKSKRQKEKGNAKPRPACRPREFNSPEEFGEAVNEYFQICRENKLPFTISGLCVHLNVDRGILEDYETREEFSHIIKKTRQIIETDKEMGGLTGQYNPAMAIFSLKHNHGWKDTQNIHVNGSSEFFQAILAKSEKVDEDGRIKI